MNYKFYFPLLLLVPFLGFANVNEAQDYWVCKTRDNSDREWVVKNKYQKIALNISFDSCKKQSKKPMTCKTSNNSCEGFHLGLSTKPYWRCVAIDSKAAAWKSNYYPNKDDAYMAAKAYCKSKSKIPDTCYVHVLSCENINDNAVEQQ